MRHRDSPHAGLRGGAVGAMVAALAVAAHGCAGGGFPDSVGGALVLLLAALAGTTVTRLPGSRFGVRGVLGVLGVLAVGQLAGHSVLTGAIAHSHAATSAPSAQPPSGWMLVAHGFAMVIGGALILLAQRLYDFASATVGAALTRPRGRRIPTVIGSADAGPAPYRFHPNGAIGPRAPPALAR
ncbi:hypothetical protein [Nocardia sp. NPDC005366]|uniref:hypothetical protein n=1 Tax=Nocardia sp. NPDC005366 TaxID=3156878 RepID=UPI0033B2BF3B